MSRSVKIMFLIASVCCVMAIGIGSVAAYFTATDNSENKFVVGNVDIELTEPAWDPDNAIKAEPGKVIVKDPRITNTGDNSVFVFAEVTVPKRDIYTYDPDTKARNEKAVTPLYSLQNIGENWTLVSTDNTQDNYVKYVYAYTEANECKSLAANAVTSAVFDSIKYCYAVEGQGLDNEDELIVDVSAYAIQSDNIMADDSKDPESVWKVLGKSLETEQ